MAASVALVCLRNELELLCFALKSEFSAHFLRSLPSSLFTSQPENILLARPNSDEIKLSDFGLSRVYVGDGGMKTQVNIVDVLANC